MRYIQNTDHNDRFLYNATEPNLFKPFERIVEDTENRINISLPQSKEQETDIIYKLLAFRPFGLISITAQLRKRT